MDSQSTLALAEIDMREELRLTTHHLRAFLKSHLRIAKAGSPSAAVSVALLKHLKALTPADVGLPEVWSQHAERIEARAREEAHAEGLDNSHAPHARSA